MNNKALTIYLVLALGLALLVAPSELVYAKDPPNKVDVCHVQGNGTYHLISIADPAYQSHMDHGDGAPGQDVPGMPGFLFSATCQPIVASCQAIRSAVPGAVDGEYTRVWNATGPKFSVYCYDMAGTPAEYLTLHNNGEAANFSQYTASWSSPGTDVRTSYSKIRLDIASLLVDISDQTFSTSTGALDHPGQVSVTSMPYGVAMACGYTFYSGVANIDLTGTPFAVVDEFTTGGYLGWGEALFSMGNQVVDLNGGGYCGWINPAPYVYNPFNTTGGFQLDLGFLP